MSKNKLKYLFFFMSVMFFFTVSNKVNASDYNVEITGVTGLNYGDKIGEGKIIATSSIDGVFSFYDSNETIDSIGDIELDIIFTPYDLDSYQSKKISVNVEVLPRVIYVNFETPIYKQYDGTTNIELPSYSYIGILNEEVNIVGNLEANLAGSYVGEGITVNLSGVSIQGDKKDYYFLDLSNHSARVFPLYLEKSGENATKIVLDKDVYVDTGYSLKVVKEDVENKVNNKYTSFLKYSYIVYNHHNNILDIDSNFKITMELDEGIVSKERLTVYELTKDGEYKEIEYSYSNGKITFDIEAGSSLVFTTRDIEWNLICLFGGILVFSVLFIMVYRIKNSKIKYSKTY